MLIDNIFRTEGIREYLDDGKRVFVLGGKRYTLTLADGSETPTVTPEEFRDFLVKAKRPLPPLMPDDEGDAIPNLTERVLVNLDVEDVNTVSNPLFLTLHKIDMIILNEGFAGKLSFRTDK